MTGSRSTELPDTKADPRPGGAAGPAASGAPAVHEPPRYRVIALDCEITAYAPDGDQPLF